MQFMFSYFKSFFCLSCFPFNLHNICILLSLLRFMWNCVCVPPDELMNYAYEFCSALWLDWNIRGSNQKQRKQRRHRTFFFFFPHPCWNKGIVIHLHEKHNVLWSIIPSTWFTIVYELHFNMATHYIFVRVEITLSS